jgi:hypothetical protein
MRRKLFGFFATMSLLLCLATCVLWVRSYWRTDAVHLAGTSADWNVRSNHAGLTVSQVVHEPSGQAQWHTSSESAYALDPSSPMYGFAGFSHEHIVYDVGIFADFERRDLAMPYWFMSILLAIGPVLRLRATIRRRRRQRVGLCPACGYDLRATPDRCPECGRAAA